MTDFPDYKTVPTESLVPYARNSRTHSVEQVAQIAASIREFGFLNPIITDGKDGIIAGHGRVLAAQRLGIKELPCIEASHLTDAQRRAYVIADNKIALNADWDDDMLRIELEELDDLGVDLSITGFDLDEIGLLMNGWDSDIDPVEAHGENTDEPLSVVKVRVQPHDSRQTKEAISNALDAAGVEYEIDG